MRTGVTRKAVALIVLFFCVTCAKGKDIVVNTTKSFMAWSSIRFEITGWRVQYDSNGESKCLSLDAYTGDDVDTIEIPSHVEFRFFDGDVFIDSERIPIRQMMAGSFAGLEHLNAIIISDTITNIGYRAFADCISLKEVSIPTNVKCIGAQAFDGCTKLEKISFCDSGVEIATSAFKNCAIKTVVLGELYHGVDFSLFDNIKSLQEYIVEDSNDMYSSAHGLLCNKEQTELIACPRGIKHIVVPGTFKSIDDYLFAWLYQLETVAINDGVETVGAGAFSYDENLKAVQLPSSVREIGNSAFLGCASLMNIELNEGLLSIGEDAFSDCPFAEINLPSSLKSIGYWAFGFSGLESIEIPDGADLGEMAFYGCHD